MFSVTHIKDRFVIELLDTAPWYKVDRCMKRKQCLADNVNKAFWKMEHWLIMTEFFSCHNVFQYSYATKTIVKRLSMELKLIKQMPSGDI